MAIMGRSSPVRIAESLFSRVRSELRRGDNDGGAMPELTSGLTSGHGEMQARVDRWLLLPLMIILL